jgi:hypothetical protein
MRVEIALIIWSLAVVSSMLLTHSFNLEVFFVLLLLGLIVLDELSDTGAVHPIHPRWMRGAIAVGVLIFGWLVVSKLVDMLAG